VISVIKFRFRNFGKPDTEAGLIEVRYRSSKCGVAINRWVRDYARDIQLTGV